MKTRKILFTVMLCFIMLISVVCFASCKKKKPSGSSESTSESVSESISESQPAATSDLTFKTLTTEGQTASTKFANATTTFSFAEEITTSASYVVSKNADGSEADTDKVVDLAEGNNTFYIIETLSDNTKCTYTVTIYRNYMYTVSFITGQADVTVPSQEVEEGNLATDPGDPGITYEVGYHFEWDFDFTTPITGDVTVSARKTPNKYQITLDNTNNDLPDNTTVEVTYTLGFELPVPTSDDERMTFDGWYDSNGNRLTGSDGVSKVSYSFTSNITVVAKFIDGVLLYTLNADGTAYTVKGGPTANNIVSDEGIYIPDEYQGLPVTEVVENAFNGCSKIRKVSIPETIKLIGTDAFFGCTNLRSVEVYDVASYDGEVFYKSLNGALCKVEGEELWLTFVPRSVAVNGTFTVPEEVTTIAPGAFLKCYMTEVVITKNVTYIGEEAFKECDRLATITYDKEYTLGPDEELQALTIAKNAFVNCNAITTIELPNRISKFESEKDFFDSFPALTTIAVEEGSLEYMAEDNLLCVANGTNILYVPRSYAGVNGVFEIPAGVRGIGDNVFNGRKTITKLIVHAEVTTIGTNAFANCTALKEIEFLGSRGANLTIGVGAFTGCSALETVTFKGNGTDELDTGLITIGANAFAGNAKLTSTIFEDGVNVALIGGGAFANTGITALGYADGANIAKIGGNAYAGCNGLTSITIHATTSAVGDEAFKGCSNLASIAFAENGVNVAFGSYVFADCFKLIRVELPATVTEFQSSVFDGCDSIQEIKVDGNNPALSTDTNGVLYNKDKTVVLYYPKAQDGDLTKLANTVEEYGDTVFKNHPNITTVVIPKNVTRIGNEAFSTCRNLTSVTFEDRKLAITIGNNAFKDCSNLAEFEFNAKISEIGKYAFYKTLLTEITIPENVSSINAFAFAFTKITSINIPANVTAIGDGAFYNCDVLETITFADGDKALTFGGNKTNTNDDVNDIRYLGALQNTKVTKINFPARLKAVANYEFYGMSKVTEITFGENSNVETIGTSAFEGTSATGLTVPSKVVSIGERAYFGLKTLGDITIPATTTSIGKEAFAESSITSVTVLDATEGENEPLTIGDYAFQKSALSIVNLSSRVTTIGSVITGTTGGTSYSFDGFTGVFKGTTVQEFNIDEDNEVYGSHEGVVYEKDSDGVLVTLIYCPAGKTGEYVVPNTVTLIENQSFYGTNLTKLSFQEFETTDERYGTPILEIGSVKGIQWSAGGLDVSVFGNTKTLTEINFPSHLKAINAFMGWRRDSETNVDSIETINFSEDTGSIIIEAYAFSGLAGVTTLNLPDVSALGGYAFISMSGLENVTFGEGSSFTSIKGQTFQGCSSLTTLNMPSCVTHLESWALSSLSNIETINWGENCNVTRIDSWVFDQGNMTEFVFPDSVTTINGNPFNSVYPATKSPIKKVVIGAKMNTIVIDEDDGTTILESLPNVQEIEVSEDNTYMKAVEGVLFDLYEQTLIWWPSQKTMDGYTMPESVTSIGSAAFRGSMITEFTLSEGIQYIGGKAFQGSAIESIHIPSTVTEIGANAFSGTNLAEVTFAENSSLQKVGNQAFGNTKLVEITFPASVKQLGDTYGYVFTGCKSLKRVDLSQTQVQQLYYTFTNCDALEEVLLPTNLRTIGNYVFQNTGLLSISIPETVTTIGAMAFSNCRKLETVTFAEGSLLETIHIQAFTNCVSLESITLPASLKTIANSSTTWTSAKGETFYGCTSLTTVDLSKTKITSLTTRMFKNCTSLESVLLPATLATIEQESFMGSGIKSINFPASVTTIKNNAFEGCEKLETVTWDEQTQMTALGSGANCYIFKDCTVLFSIAIPEGITSIGQNAFYGSGLEEVVIPSTMTSISAYAFNGCDFVELTIPAHVKTIETYAFANNEYLETLTFEEGVEVIGDYSFRGCTSLEAVSFPASTVTIGANPFTDCISLSNIDFSKLQGFSVVGGVLYDANEITLLYCPTGIEEIKTFPTSLRNIAGGAFAGSDIKTISIPNTVTAISESAFSNSTKLTSVTFPTTVTEIGAKAFEGCTSLDNVFIRKEVTTIGAYAFAGCTSLVNITFEDRNTALALGGNMFKGCTNLKVIELPMTVTKFGQYMFAGSGIVEFVVPTRITSINARGLFEGCQYLERVVLHEKVGAYIAADTFKNCTSLNSIDYIDADGNIVEDSIPEGVQNFGSNAFENCTSLTKLSLPYTTFDIGSYCFYNCTGIVELEIRDEDGYAHNGYFGEYCFANMTSLEHIYIPSTDWEDGLYFGVSMFEGNTSLKTLKCGWSWYIDSRMCYGCTALETVEFEYVCDGGYEDAFYGVTDKCTITLTCWDIDSFDGTWNNCEATINITEE